MRIVNTARPRRSFLFLAKCGTCPTAKFVWAVAWRVPEATFAEAFRNRRDWLRCVVCLGLMGGGYAMPLDESSERAVVARLGSEPTPGTIRIVE